MLRKSLSLKTFPLAFALLLFAFLPALHAQCKPPADQHPVLSPAAEASVTLDGKTVTVFYCAPSARGRKVIGALVPYDKVWRTGANTSTTLKTETAADAVVPVEAKPKRTRVSRAAAAATDGETKKPARKRTTAPRKKSS